MKTQSDPFAGYKSFFNTKMTPEQLLKEHDKDVAIIAERVKEFAKGQKPFRLYHGSTNSTRRSDRRKDTTVDTSELRRVLAVDPKSKTALVEPNVGMDLLVGASLAHKMVPPVVMEFPGITVGGGFSGTSGESSSFRHGVFEQTVNWIEIVLPTGEVTRASPTYKQDLFWGAASAFGTLGVVTLLEVRLIKAKPWVELTYVLDTSAADATATIEKETAKAENDYVDSIIFAPDRAITCVGKLADILPDDAHEQCFTRRYDPWFYTHVQNYIMPKLLREAKKAKKAQTVKSAATATTSSSDEKKAPVATTTNGNGEAAADKTAASTTDGDVEKKKSDDAMEEPDAPSSSPSSPSNTYHEFVPLVDYLFRYDRGAFWGALWAFKYFHMPFNFFTRYFLDSLLHTRVMFRALHKSGLGDFYLAQDVAVPVARVPEFAAWVDSTLKMYPIWLCPLLGRREGFTDAAHGLHSALGKPDSPDVINFGIWGPVPGNTRDRHEVVRVNREIEAKVAELGGKKCLYAHAYYTEEEFWAHYDKVSYDAVRRKYGAEWLPSVYDKVKVDVEAEERAFREKSALKRAAYKVWPIRGVYGVIKAIKGGDYLLQKKTAKKEQQGRKEVKKEGGKEGKKEGKEKEDGKEKKVEVKTEEEDKAAKKAEDTPKDTGVEVDGPETATAV